MTGKDNKAENTLKIDYSVMNPTGNITILVETSVPTACQPYIAERLMELEPEAEQVGFLSADDSCDIALRMAGGEFCGNASLSAAVYAAEKMPVAGRKEEYNLKLRVSGAPEPIRTKLLYSGDGEWIGTVEMPGPVKIEKIMLPDAGLLPVVRFEGISHVIIEETSRFYDCMQSSCRNDGRVIAGEQSAGAYARRWCDFLHADAVGLMFLERDSGLLTPLVYVPAADTLCWESSCASGTTAAGAYLAEESGTPFTITLKQPGGSLKVEVSEDGVLRLTGKVALLRRESTQLSC